MAENALTAEVCFAFLSISCQITRPLLSVGAIYPHLYIGN